MEETRSDCIGLHRSGSIEQAKNGTEAPEPLPAPDPLPAGIGIRGCANLMDRQVSTVELFLTVEAKTDQ